MYRTSLQLQIDHYFNSTSIKLYIAQFLSIQRSTRSSTKQRFKFISTGSMYFREITNLCTACYHIIVQGLSVVREQGCTDTSPGCGYNSNCEDKVKSSLFFI